MMLSPKPAPLPRIYAWFAAVSANDMDLLETLLAHGVPIDVPHPLRHSTALMEATRRGHATTVQWLIERGATPAFLCGSPMGTALHCAVRCRHWEIAYRIVDAMDSCAVMDGYGATPLHTLCSEPLNPGDQDSALVLASIFIAKDCPLDALDHDGTTALHHAVINDFTKMADLLLIRGANANALIPDSQVSALTIAALEKNATMAQLLMHYGADPTINTREGTTALSIYPALAELMPEKLTYASSPQKHARGVISVAHS